MGTHSVIGGCLHSRCLYLSRPSQAHFTVNGEKWVGVWHSSTQPGMDTYKVCLPQCSLKIMKYESYKRAEFQFLLLTQPVPQQRPQKSVQLSCLFLWANSEQERFLPLWSKGPVYTSSYNLNYILWYQQWLLWNLISANTWKQYHPNLLCDYSYKFSLGSCNTHHSHRALLTIDLKNLSTSVSFWPVRSQVLLLLMSFFSSKVQALFSNTTWKFTNYSCIDFAL